MTPCTRCRRHLAAATSTCPFCGASQRMGLAGRVMSSVGGSVTMVVLSACYGVPYDEKDTTYYTDLDRYPTDTDTDTTPVVDVDEDGWSPPEDCDDANAAVNPDATEDCANAIDDDCDTTTDLDDPDCAGTPGGGTTN